MIELIFAAYATAAGTMPHAAFNEMLVATDSGPVPPAEFAQLCGQLLPPADPDRGLELRSFACLLQMGEEEEVRETFLSVFEWSSSRVG